MGNSPSVSGPERGSPHVERDITMDDHLAGQRPANYNTGDSELADEETVLNSNRKSHFKVITEKPVSASNRKSSDNEDALRSPVSYISPFSCLRCIKMCVIA